MDVKAPLDHFYMKSAAAFCAVLAFSTIPVAAQVSPEEHAAHHPGQVQPVATQPESPPGPGMRPDFAPGPPAGQQMGGGMMGEMGGMMGAMGAPAPKELYPSLMALPELSPQQRDQVQSMAVERMQAGVSRMSAALEQLTQEVSAGNYAAMQNSIAGLHDALSQFESGVAAQRALAEDRPPRAVAMEWFKQEMNLLPSPSPHGAGGPFGLSWFHFFAMAVLVLFAAVMIWMYFFKMRRAAALLQDLTGGAALPPGAPASTAVPVPVAPPAPAAPVDAAQSVGKKWSGKLRVSRVFQETPDVKTFRLMNPLGGVLPFTYLPGQFLTVAVAPDGAPVKRSYTIASSPTQHDYVEITVKHKEGGVVSGFLHTRVQPGDLLECSAPSGSFIFTGRECKCILLVGGGVGITPLMSVIRYLTDRSWAGDIYFLYSISKPQDFIFREELEYLERRHPNLRVIVAVSHSDGAEWKGPKGRITKELIVQSVPDLASRYVHVCGPVPMMEAVKKMLNEVGVPADRIKTEAFGPALGKPEPNRPPPAPAPPAGVALPTVAFSSSDKSAPLPPDKTILDVADEIGVEIDNSCRAGTCGTCRVKLLSGKVTMAVEDGREPGDKEQGIVLACQAKSTGNVTVEA
ncbi:MAG: hypothetical protein AMXMBFR13_50660 [Phycisphaerae bacterium]